MLRGNGVASFFVTYSKVSVTSGVCDSRMKFVPLRGNMKLN